MNLTTAAAMDLLTRLRTESVLTPDDLKDLSEQAAGWILKGAQTQDMDLVSRGRQLQYLVEFKRVFALGLKQLDSQQVDWFCLQFKSDILLVLGHYVLYTGNNTLDVYAQCRVVYMRTRMSFFYLGE